MVSGIPLVLGRRATMHDSSIFVGPYEGREASRGSGAEGRASSADHNVGNSSGPYATLDNPQFLQSRLGTQTCPDCEGGR